jgi:CO/xanthine dehydrogenase Mo-binding subunit
MSQQDAQKKGQSGKLRIEAKIPDSVIIVNQPAVRDFSTGGGHGPEQTLTEGDDKITIKKWQGYPPDNLNLIGKPHPAMPDVAIPRYTGKAMYATRVLKPNMLHVKVLVSPHARAMVKSIDTSAAEKMPGVHFILTKDNSPKTYPMPTELFFQGEMVAFVAAETEDQAEDATLAIKVEYDMLPSVTSLEQAMASNPPDMSSKRTGRPSVSKGMVEWGDVDKAFEKADVVKEFSYFFNGGIIFPFQPLSCEAEWDGDKLTMYVLTQRTYSTRTIIAKSLGITGEFTDQESKFDQEKSYDQGQMVKAGNKVRVIDKWNGGSFGGADGAMDRINPWIGYIAKMTGRPVRLIFPKEQELPVLRVKPQNLTKFKVGAMKDGRIIAIAREFHINTGCNPANESAINPGTGGGGRSEIYLHTCPNWRETGFLYRTNTLRTGSSRSNSQQEFKWSWEQMMDEMAEALDMDPVKLRLLNTPHPGTKVGIGQGGPTITPMPEMENGLLTYDCYAGKECLEEGAKNIGWDQRNPVAGGNPGRWKRGFGVSMNQHHAGRVGYQEGEGGYEWVTSRDLNAGGQGAGSEVYNGEIVINADGHLVLYHGQPDSGTNHDTSMSIQVGEILGYTHLDHIHIVWGDTDLVPVSPGWGSGLTTQLQGGAFCNAADKLRKDVFKRASGALKLDAEKLQLRDGVLSSRDDPKKRITFAELVKQNNGPIHMGGRACHPSSIGRAMMRGVGACFLEVEVDTWTGDWRYVKAAYAHDAGHVMNPQLANNDQDGSLVQCLGETTDSIPWDKEFPGTRHYAVGYLSYRIPTIMDTPQQTNIFINSLEPRWFFGSKGFAETSIGCPPGALANAIYNACGVRIREHPVTREAIMAGLTELKKKGKVIA